jgi:hypothetical protein
MAACTAQPVSLTSSAASAAGSSPLRSNNVGKLTKLQEITIQRIKDAKGKAYKVSSVEEVKSILANLEV